jgi:hypothetical protein
LVEVADSGKEDVGVMFEITDPDIAGVTEKTANMFFVMTMIDAEPPVISSRVGSVADCALSLLASKYPFVASGWKPVGLFKLIVSVTIRIFAAPIGRVEGRFLWIALSPSFDFGAVLFRMVPTVLTHCFSIAECALISVAERFISAFDKFGEWLFGLARVAGPDRHVLPSS